MSDSPVTGPLVLYDGVCGLCHRFVQWILAHDVEGRIAFAPLQGTTTRALRERFTDLPTSLDTLVLVQDDTLHLRSTAVLRVMVLLPFPWRLARVLLWIPRPIRDVVYGWIARSRYRIWGRVDRCRLPSPDEQHRFLD